MTLSEDELIDTGRLGLYLGPRVIISAALPLVPSERENNRRFIRHLVGEEVYAWLGEEVGPKPGEETHAMMMGATVCVSHDLYLRMKERIYRTDEPVAIAASGVVTDLFRRMREGL